MKKIFLTVTLLFTLLIGYGQLNRAYYDEPLQEIKIQDAEFKHLEQFYPVRNEFTVTVLPSGEQYNYEVPKFYKNKTTAFAIWPDGRIEGVSGDLKKSITSRKGKYELITGSPDEEFFCNVIDSNLTHETSNTRTARCVGIYIELDYGFYQTTSYGIDTIDNAIDYMMACFGIWQLLYSNDTIDIGLESIAIWDHEDPYGSGNAALLAFKDIRGGDPDYSDVNCLFANEPGTYGGVGFLNGLGTSYNICYADVNTGWADYPNYYWNFMVMAHEVGHVLNCFHTHNCSWVGGAIDGCYNSEAYGGWDCPDGPDPVDGGTIMSYCHLTAFGVNFLNGFGPQPGTKIRNTVNSAAFLDICNPLEDTTVIIGEFLECESYGIDATKYIDYVSLNSFKRISGNDDGYYHDTVDTIFLTATGYNKLVLSSNSAVPMYWQVFIDYNEDGVFVGEGVDYYGERVAYGITTTTGKMSRYFITSWIVGRKNMRVMMSTEGYQDPCDINFVGEVEDYEIVIIDNTDLDNVPIPENTYLYIYNLQGQLIYKGKSDENFHDILPAGIYIMKSDYFTKEFINTK